MLLTGQWKATSGRLRPPDFSTPVFIGLETDRTAQQLRTESRTD
jgi:hypothetical protein